MNTVQITQQAREFDKCDRNSAIDRGEPLQQFGYCGFSKTENINPQSDNYGRAEMDIQALRIMPKNTTHRVFGIASVTGETYVQNQTFAIGGTANIWNTGQCTFRPLDPIFVVGVRPNEVNINDHIGLLGTGSRMKERGMLFDSKKLVGILFNFNPALSNLQHTHIIMGGGKTRQIQPDEVFHLGICTKGGPPGAELTFLREKPRFVLAD